MVDPEARDPDPSETAALLALRSLHLFEHDIRAAISDVVGGLRLIERSRLAPEARVQIDRVQAAADTLAGLVDDALMTVAGEAVIGRAEGLMRLGDWLAALNGRWSGRATEAGTAFVVERRGELPGHLNLSPVTLDRIAGNLVSNALRHAGAGGVRLVVEGQPGAGLILSVRDDGPGYPRAVLDRMARGGAYPARGGGGALAPGGGLGLRIAAELTREIGGTLVLENPDGGGALARLTLPEALLRYGPETLPEPGAQPDLGGLSILLAEDNLTNQTILRRVLGGMGAEIVLVGDGVAALEAVEARAFDIALIDIEMPRLSGLEVMQAVRARGDARAALPMVALTAYVLRDNREAIYAAGADGIIGKPIASAAEFGRAILRYAGRPAGLPEPEDVLGRGAGDPALGQKMDAARFEALLAVAGPDRAELLTRLISDLGGVLAALDGALEAGDLPEIRAQTHILIAVSGAVGADRLYRLAEVLNIAAKRRRLGDLAALYAPCRADLEDLIAYVADRAARPDPD
ncbi:response regulator [Roseicyclus marinus]|uniref:response regulator n=1 Tax=Roseicyclus marinus TaxID=2161673 RepID=UPI00240FB133|nr:response regulator [Roseicyclus marinus]MDG3043078.1 response regulator [Roseicyclus marinus]